MLRRIISVGAMSLFVVTLAFNAQAQKQSLKEVWKVYEGTRGVLAAEARGYSFTPAAEGRFIVTFVGDDYVQFRAWSEIAGAKVERRVIPLSNLELRAKW